MWRCHFVSRLQAWPAPGGAPECCEGPSVAGGQAGVPLQAVGAEEPLPVSPWGWQCSAQPAALLGRLALLWGQEGGPTFLRQGWTGAAWPGVPLLFAFQCQAFYLGLLPLSLKINSSLCCCEEVPNTPPHPGNSRGSLGSLPTPRAQEAWLHCRLPGHCSVRLGAWFFKDGSAFTSHLCFLSLSPQNVLIRRHKHRPAGPERALKRPPDLSSHLCVGVH